jgi:uncharacterized membrane protein
MMIAVLKLIHVLAVIAFVGNITVGLFWKRFADATRDPAIIAHTIAGIIRADSIFTIPGIVVIVAAGVATAMAAGYPILGTGWILWGIIFFGIAGAAFGPVARAQRLLLDLARQSSASGDLDWPEYRRLSSTWDLWGTIALIAPLISVALMVLKPDLPAFHR